MNRSFGNLSIFKGAGRLWIGGYALLLFFIYRATLAYLYSRWQEDDFTYCFMIPAIVCYLLWERRESLAALPSIPSWKGFIPIGLGTVLFVIGELAAEYVSLYLSLWLAVAGLSWLHLGWRKLRSISFPLLFSLAMFVPPSIVYNPITFRLKLVSSWLGVLLMQAWGLSAYREGNIIDLGFTRIQVVDACSGLRFVIPLVIMGVLLASYFRGPLWKRLLLVASTIPLSVFTNSLRIALVGILYQFMGAAAAEGFFHDFSGWFIFMVSLALLLVEMWALNKLFPEPVSLHESRATNPESRVPSPESRPSASRLGAAALLALLALLAVRHLVGFSEKIPPLKSFADFPVTAGEWSGRRAHLEQEVLDTLQLSDYALIDYRNGHGKEVGFYLAYNGSQTKRKATHSPAACLPGSGWDFRELGTVLLPANSGGSPLRVNRAVMEKNGVRQMIYYWFPQRGRILTDLYQVKFYNFWDALTRHRTDGALVRLITPVYGTEPPADAEARLQEFTGTIAPALERYLPGS